MSFALRLGVLDVGTFARSIKLAPRVEALGYQRYWISEHHGEGAIPNPTILIPVIAAATRTMRVGTAGVLLRFHSALAVAENFRLLTGLFPGRIDLGIARALTPSAQTQALYDGRSESYSEDDHAAKIIDVQNLVCGRLPEGHLLTGERIDPPLGKLAPPPLWVDSTSLAGARLAARIGAHYSFHCHYRHELAPEAVKLYIDEFQTSPELSKPSWNVAVAGYCAESEDDARDAQEKMFSKTAASGRRVICGTIDLWRKELAELVESCMVEEVIVQSLAREYDLERQVASYARIAEAARSLP